MVKKMKKVAAIIFIYAGIICAQDSPVIEMYSGWCWYPYSSYYYPYSSHLYNPWYYQTGRRHLYPYNYPEDSGWYDNGAPYYYPYGGFCFHNRSVVINLKPDAFLDLSEIDKRPALPGSAPLCLRSEDTVSVQSERLKRFLSINSDTNSPLTQRHGDTEFFKQD